MLLRAFIACCVVFGAFAIAAWAVAPKGGWATLYVPKEDVAAKEPPPAAADAPLVKAVRTQTIAPAPPPPKSFDTALLTPQATVAPPVPDAAAAPEPPRDPRKPFRCPRGTPAASGPPTVAQITRIESALKLAPEQEKHWRPVQGALVEIARGFENPTIDERRRKALVSVERMQQIYWMAGPLVMSLREDQKRDARNLACSLGLATLAALI